MSGNNGDFLNKFRKLGERRPGWIPGYSFATLSFMAQMVIAKLNEDFLVFEFIANHMPSRVHSLASLKVRDLRRDMDPPDLIEDITKFSLGARGGH
ncbi:hypothetical protein A3748_13720 [Erythrobacter sp. HI0077]|nr:hypothetical protein A3745_11175 [Erythrobacter sp. HI0074]KZZ07759.1 hypothetical protein A3748_13720 [Erythrobacter sp. HI0077]